ncbi:MAG: ATP-binding cassette domain-containing protein [Capsulimonadaceae bacterium]
MASILNTRGLCRRFGSVTAVRDLSISVEAGEAFGLLGPNGAGKSTAIKMMTTLLPPTAGSATIGGFDLRRQANEVRRIIGYVPQMVSADGSLTGYENLLLFAKLYGLRGPVRERRIWEALELMDLTDAAHRMVKTYSGGMLRRVEIAQSMIHRPELLFLDEPTVGLDPIARDSVWQQMERLRLDYGTTIFMTTHYMEEADLLCGRIAIMHRGDIVGVGTPEELKRSVDKENASLDDVFVHYAGQALIEGETGGFREAGRSRRAAIRHG